MQVHTAAQDLWLGLPGISEQQERAARRALREQIARLERELSEALIAAFPHCGPHLGIRAPGGPRVLGLGELEQVRDGLVVRLADTRSVLAARAEQYERNRVLLERMLLEPGRYKFARIRQADLGERGCGAWQVRPRLGLIGMLMGWWQVKLSSGCPLAT
ncbi:MAG TPA: hypothetical protein VFT42_02815 [Solirubrobacteraceae bacterium]|nr:hypothetical protein [Solirubrobacteraceae bacterium]